VSQHKTNSLLIVDDGTENIASIINMLCEEYIVFIASDGHQAAELSAEHSPDVILLGVAMPSADGYQTLAMLKNTLATAEIPVIFISGPRNSVDEEKALAADYVGKPFSPGVVKLRVRNQIHLINQIRAIEHLSMMDPLTNIANRRNFDNRLSWEWNRAIRDQTPISILMLDIDHFKRYNDIYGHPQGDAALKSCAKLFTKCLSRSVDFVARWGGEEFAVLLPNTDSQGSVHVAEHIRVAVQENVVLTPEAEETRVTISIGVNTQIPTPSSQCDHFISRADGALYTAKGSGRNRVCRYEI